MEANQESQVQANQDFLPIQKKPRYPGSKGIRIEDLIELRSKGLTLAQIAKTMDLNPRTVWTRLKASGYALESVENYRKHRSTVLAYEQNRIRQHLTDAKLSKASARDLVVSFGILYDKERLESGLSTQNIAYADMVQAMRRLEDEESRLKAESTRGGVE